MGIPIAATGVGAESISALLSFWADMESAPTVVILNMVWPLAN